MKPKKCRQTEDIQYKLGRIDKIREQKELSKGEKLRVNQPMRKVNNKVPEGFREIRSDILDEIWSAKKKLVDGKWYIELSEVCDILSH